MFDCRTGLDYFSWSLATCSKVQKRANRQCLAQPLLVLKGPARCARIVQKNPAIHAVSCDVRTAHVSSVTVSQDLVQLRLPRLSRFEAGQPRDQLVSHKMNESTVHNHDHSCVSPSRGDDIDYPSRDHRRRLGIVLVGGPCFFFF